MKKTIVIMATALALVGCRENPFFAEWDTPYGIPPFEKIKVGDYIPAVEEGIRQQNEEISAIVNCAEAPTFENTVAALDLSGGLLEKVEGVLFNLSETDGTPELQRVVEKVIPMVSQHSSNIYLNSSLFERVQKVYADSEFARESGCEDCGAALSREQQMLLDKVYRAFVANGVALDSLKQDRMRQINSSLASLEQTFGTNLLAENNAFAAEFGISISQYAATMGSCSNRELREKMFRAYSTRGANGGATDNREIIMKILSLRQEKARLLGYDTPAAFILSDKMAGTPEAVDSFLETIITPAVAKAREELVDCRRLWIKTSPTGCFLRGAACSLGTGLIIQSVCVKTNTTSTRLRHVHISRWRMSVRVYSRQPPSSTASASSLLKALRNITRTWKYSVFLTLQTEVFWEYSPPTTILAEQNAEERG